MKCSDLQYNLSLYADGFLSASESESIRDHLLVCPLCRQKNAEYLEIRSQLRRISRPDLSAHFSKQIKDNVLARRQVKQIFAPTGDAGRWLQMRVMPYTVGVVTSVFVGISFLMMMFSGIFQPAPSQPVAGGSSVLIASDRGANGNAPVSGISASDFARSRVGLGNESPSVNPQGALVNLTKALIQGGMKDDEVVVVADVYGDGLAQISEVVEPSRDGHAIEELQRALSSGPSNPAFVPASLENRADSVRVVLKFQSVDVNIGPRHGRTSL